MQTEKMIVMINDVHIHKNVRLIFILELLYNNEISCTKAKELCLELGLFTDTDSILQANAQADVTFAEYKL